MKNLYMIGGTMGVGKSTVCQALKRRLEHSVFLDGDWCWDAHPFQVTAETKKMVLQNICFLLNQFLHCSAYTHIIFCWVLHEQEILDEILAGLDKADCDSVQCVSLVCDEAILQARLQRDIESGIRTPDILKRSIARMPLYAALKTDKIDTTNKRVEEVVDCILAL